ncbi:unnamed protein product, partial [Polarella glacialis]
MTWQAIATPTWASGATYGRAVPVLCLVLLASIPTLRSGSAGSHGSCLATASVKRRLSSFCGSSAPQFPVTGSWHQSCPRSATATTGVEVHDRATALKILGFDRSSNAPGDKEIKQAFRREVSRLHPDRQGGNRGREEQFSQVLDAYALLTGKKSEQAQTGPWHGKPGHQRPFRVKSDEELEAERSAHYKRPENWRWDQNVGYNPSDLGEVWDEIGFNPYTGEYHAPKEKPEEE